MHLSLSHILLSDVSLLTCLYITVPLFLFHIPYYVYSRSIPCGETGTAVASQFILPS